MADIFKFNPFTGTFDITSDVTGGVTSVNGETGDVILDSSDIAEGSNLYFTDERAQDAVGASLTDSSTVDLTYNDAGNTITAAVNANSIDETHITASVAGSGLTGGNGAPLDVGAGDGISVSADAVSVDNTVIRNDGSVDFTADQSMGGFKLTNLANPTTDQDAATKFYIDDALTNYIPSLEKGSANGVATLDGGGKVPVAQLPSAVMTYEGVWNANTNTPTLADGVGDAGMVYRVSVAGTQDLGSGPISFEVGDYAIYNGTIWEKSDTTDAVASVNGLVGIVVLDTDDINEGATNLYYTDERAQDAIGGILTDTASINLTYNDGVPSISADVIPGGVDHDQLLNFVANEHVDHSTVQIATASNTSGLAGGGDITTTRNLSVDINGTTAETNADNADKVLIYDNSATALKSMTRANFLSGIAQASAGDINETAFTGVLNNQSTPANVTGLVFSGSVASFNSQVAVYIDTTPTLLYETFTLKGVQTDSGWDMAVSSVGEDSQVNFSINGSGQVQYTTPNYTGFIEGSIKFRAETLTV